MSEPVAIRPHMPGYGILGPGEGTGLLTWPWAEEHLDHSHDYWVATVRPDLHPHLMPVWGIWHEMSLWFSSSNGSRKARNVASNPRCAVATDNPYEPLVVEGTVDLIVDREAIEVFARLVDAKYATNYGADFYDPAINSIFRVRPRSVFGLTQHDFAGSPTRWIFGDDPN